MPCRMHEKKESRAEAAVFDVDGTLIPGSAERHFFGRLYRSRLLRPVGIARWFTHGLRNMGGGYAGMFMANKCYLAGLPVAEAGRLAAALYAERLSILIPPKARAEIRWHKKMGRKIILLSGMPGFILKHFARDLDAHLSYGCRLRIAGGRYTGDLLHGHLSAAAKGERLRAIAEEHRIDLGASYGYGNHGTDRFFLEIVGNPSAVHPDRKLRKIAFRHNWRIIDKWHDGETLLPLPQMEVEHVVQ